MTTHSLTISQPHSEAMRSHLFPRSGHEAGAILLCGLADVSACPWTGEPLRRFLSREVILIPPEDIASSSSRNFEWRKSTFLKAYRRARDQKLAIGFIHSHRDIHAFFSNVDDRNDSDLAELVGHRQAPRPDLLSIVVDVTGRAVARLCQSPTRRIELKNVGLLENRSWIWTVPDNAEVTDGTFDRQELAFGPEFLKILRKLRITVVGAGATGSATIQLLMRLGAKYLAAIDPELVEISNPTRIHCSRKEDARRGVSKVEVAKRAIDDGGFDVEFRYFKAFVTDAEVRDVLKASDLIFGSTDDHEGRLFLNRLSLFYNTPLIDMGIIIDPTRGRENHVLLADGRVTVVAPGLRCLLCRQIVNSVQAREENLRRSNPAEFKRQQGEGYIVTQFVSAPSVVTLTTSVACMAVDELTARLTEYRRTGDHRLHKFVQKKDFSPGASASPCSVCSADIWGRGTESVS